MATTRCTWTMPSSAGSSPIQFFQLERKVSTSSVWEVLATTVVETLSFDDFSVVDGVTYDYRVAARNATQLGAYSPVRTVTLPGGTASTPSVPTTVVASQPADGTARVTWQPPLSTGGSAVTGYRLVINIGSSTAGWPSFGNAYAGATITSGTTTVDVAASARTYDFVGLPVGTYTITVSALNAVGVGPGVTVQQAITDTTPPPTGTQVIDAFGADGSPWDPLIWQTAGTSGFAFTQAFGDGDVIAGTQGNNLDRARARTIASYPRGATRVELVPYSTNDYLMSVSCCEPTSAPLDVAAGYFPQTGYFVDVNQATGLARLRKATAGAVVTLASATVALMAGQPFMVLIDPRSTGVVASVWPSSGAQPATPTLTSTDTSFSEGRIGIALQGGLATSGYLFSADNITWTAAASAGGSTPPPDPGPTEYAPLRLWDYSTNDTSQWSDVQGPLPTIVSSPDPVFTRAARFTITDSSRPTWDATNVRRSELTTFPDSWIGDPAPGMVQWWAGTVWLPATIVPPTNEPTNGGWLYLTQWHHTGTTGQVPLALRVPHTTTPPRLSIHTAPGSPAFDLGAISEGTAQTIDGVACRRFDWKLRVLWHDNATLGRLSVWVNGVQKVTDQPCATLLTGQSVYPKQGLYGNRYTSGTTQEPAQTAFFTGLRYGPTEGSITVPTGSGATLPSVPTSTSVTGITSSAATLNWQPPTTPGGTITGYYVERDGVDANGTGVWGTTLLATARAFTFQQLVGPATYNLRVRAINAAGSGTWATAPAVIPASTSAYTVAGTELRQPNGSRFEVRGANTSVRTTSFPYVFENNVVTNASGYTLPEYFTEAQGNTHGWSWTNFGGINGTDWNDLTMVRIQKALDMGWNTVRVNLVLHSDDGTSMTPQLAMTRAEPGIRRLADAGMVVIVEAHDLTGKDLAWGSPLEVACRAFWDDFCTRYADHPRIWANPYNEPVSWTNYTLWRDFHLSLTQRMVAQGYSGKPLMLDLPRYGQGIDALGAGTLDAALTSIKAVYPHIVLGWHAYGSSTEAGGSTIASHTAQAQAAVARGHCIVVGEFGVNHYLSDPAPVNTANTTVAADWVLDHMRTAVPQLNGALIWHSHGDMKHPLTTDRRPFWEKALPVGLNTYGTKFYNWARSGSSGSATPLFSDEFTGTSLDSTKWRVGAPYQTTSFKMDADTWVVKPPDSETLTVANSELTLKMRRRQVSGQPTNVPFTGCNINTDSDTHPTSDPALSRFALPGGSTYTEARVWVPSAKGAWSALWFMGLGDTSPNNWPRTGEIDFEWFNNTTTAGVNGYCQVNLHWYDGSYAGSPNGGHLQAAKIIPVNCFNRWSRLGLVRTPSTMAFYIDGVEGARYNLGALQENFAGSGFWNNPPDPILWSAPMSILVDAKTGGWAGNGYTSAQWENGDFKLDYVRVWSVASNFVPS